jgi:nucleoside-diphosphate-sugar epimerase
MRSESRWTGDSSKLGYEVFVRAIADAVMLNGAMVVGIAASVLFAAGRTEETATGAFTNALAAYGRWGWLGTILALGVFYASGFYTRGRGYSSRYKALIVLQAVAVTFLIFGSLSFLLPEFVVLPRAALITGALTAAALIGGSRIWSAIWRRVSYTENTTVVANTPKDRAESVLVIGGAGYVGSALLRKLLDRGYRVRLLDMFMYGNEPIQDMVGHRNLEIVQADFRQVDKIVEAVQGMDAVIHIGAIVGDPACALDEDFTIEVNLTATRMIADVAKAHGINRFIFASTCSVYGASDEYLDERSSLNPVSLYARSKIASERVLLRMANEHFQPTILRFGTVYGLSGRTRFDLVVNLLTAKAVVDSKITVFGADQWRPFVHVEDTALAVVRVLEAPLAAVGSEIFNVGSDAQNKTLGQIGEMIRAQVPTAELIASGTDGDRRNYRVDFSKLKNRVGFAPEWTLEKGVAQVVEAFRSGKVTDYHEARYSNVKFLTEEAGQKLVRTQTEWLRALIEDATPTDVVRDDKPSSNGHVILK